MVLNQFNKAQEAKQQASNPPPEPKGPTLATVLADPKQNALFGAMLEKEGGMKGFGERMAKGQLNQADLAKAEEMRENFFKKMESVKSVDKSVSPEKLAEFAKNSPEFAKILNLAGPEKSAKAIKHQLELLAIKDPDRFETLSNAMNDLKSYENGAYKDTDQKVHKLCEKYKIDENKYAEILTIDDDAKREKALRKEIHNKYGNFKKATNWLTGGALGKGKMNRFNADSAAEHVERDDIQLAVDQMNKELGAVGDVLSTTISESKEVRTALSHEIAGKDIKDLAPEKLSKFPSKKDLPTAEQINDSWDEHKHSKKLDKKAWDALGPVKQEEERNKFIEKMKEDGKKKMGGGFWAFIQETFLNDKLDNHDKRSLN